MPRFRLPLLLALALVLVLGAPAAGTGAATAVVDAHLTEALATATGPLEVVVTFAGEGAPTAAHVSALEAAGVTAGYTFSALPMAGVLATPAQVAALAASPDVVSLWLNRPLAYDNASSTALTGVDAVRADEKLTKRNGNLPVAGHGVTVLVNDSGVDGGHLDHRFGPHLVPNVAATTNLNSTS
jgi:serine protease AprX